MNRYFLTPVVGLFVASVTAQAHPGHSPIDASPYHVLLNPGHLGALLIAVVSAFCVIRALRWKRTDVHKRIRSLEAAAA